MDRKPDHQPEQGNLPPEPIIEADVEEAMERIAALHPTDLARLFKALDRERWPELLGRLGVDRTSRLMEELPDYLREELAEHLGDDRLARIIEEMTSDDAADVLADLPEEMASEVIEALPRADRQEVEVVLGHAEDSAGRLMQVELVAVHERTTVDEAVEAIRRSPDDAGAIHAVYVVDGGHRLVGVVQLVQLLLARGEEPINALMDTGFHAATPDVDRERVAQIFCRYDLLELPVVERSGRLLGRILLDDVVDVLELEADEDIMHMVGVGHEEPELVYSDRKLRIATARLPWLLATMGGLVVSALLYWQFQLSFPHLLALVPFIPVISAMGGNVGTQSSTIVVRGFAIGRVDFRNLGRVIVRELLVGAMMGVACGVVTGIVATVWHHDAMLSVTVAVAMVTAISNAALVGVLVPYLFRWIGIDPAIAAGPLVTTLNDVLSAAIYYGVALLLIQR
jgi:magnesium transporter